MLSVFHAVSPCLTAFTFHVRIDMIGLGGYRTRWNRTSYTLPGLKSRIHASRTQLITLFGDEFYAVVWQEVLDLEQQLFEALRALERIKATDLAEKLMTVVYHTPEEPADLSSEG